MEQHCLPLLMRSKMQRSPSLRRKLMKIYQRVMHLMTVGISPKLKKRMKMALTGPAKRMTRFRQSTLKRRLRSRTNPKERRLKK